MMKKLIAATTLFASALTFAGNTYIPATEPVTPMTQQAAASQFYGGIALAAIATYGDSLDWFSNKSGEDRTGGIVGILGYQFTPHVAVEGRVTLGIISPDFSESTNVSLFLKPSYNITPEFAVYGLLGFGWVKIDGHNGYNDIITKVSPQIGLGTSYKLNEKVDLFADYTWLLHNKKAKTPMPDGHPKVSHEAVTVGMNYHF